MSVQDQESETNISSSVISSFVNNSPESLHQLKSFLESNDASSKFSNLIDIEGFYESKDIKFLSRFGTIFLNRFHDYYLGITNFKIMDESNTIEIETFGFSAEHALRANIALIYISSEFFDQRERLSASIALAKKRCELAISKSDDINEVFIDPTPNQTIDLNMFDSANDLISSKSSNIVVSVNLKLYLVPINVRKYAVTSEYLIVHAFDSPSYLKYLAGNPRLSFNFLIKVTSFLL